MRLQRYFGVSFRAMLYGLLRLRLLSEADLSDSQNRQSATAAIGLVDGIPLLEGGAL